MHARTFADYDRRFERDSTQVEPTSIATRLSFTLGLYTIKTTDFLHLADCDSPHARDFGDEKIERARARHALRLQLPNKPMQRTRRVCARLQPQLRTQKRAFHLNPRHDSLATLGALRLCSRSPCRQATCARVKFARVAAGSTA